MEDQMTISTSDQTILKALIKATHAFTDSLEAVLQLGDASPNQAPTPIDPAVGLQTGGGPTFDPLTDEPPLALDPIGTSQQQNMSWLTYIGAIRAINQREGRGATRDEVVQYAKKAGYPDGRGVSGFSNKGGATYSENGTRWVNKGGVDWLTKLQVKLGVTLPADLL